MAVKPKKKLTLDLACAGNKDADLVFYLEKEGNTVNLMAKKDTTTQYILAINPDGTLFRHDGISKSLNLSLDEYQRVKLSKAWLL